MMYGLLQGVGMRNVRNDKIVRITVIPAIQIVMYIVGRIYNGLVVGRRLG